MFTIRKTIEIDAGHRIPFHNSHCRFIHGHRYQITATVGAKELQKADTKASDAGMVMDFKSLKNLMMDLIHAPCDHRLMLWTHDPIVAGLPPAVRKMKRGEYGYHLADENNELVASITVVPCIPTAEGLAEYWGRRLADHILEPLHLMELEVRETPTGCARWINEFRLRRSDSAAPERQET